MSLRISNRGLALIALSGFLGLMFTPTDNAFAAEPPPAPDVAIVEEALTAVTPETPDVALSTDVVAETTPDVAIEPVSVQPDAIPAQAAAVAAPIAALAKKPAPATKAVDWLMAYDGESYPTAPTWPQTLYTDEVCGSQWIQSDVYRYETDKQIAIVDGLIAGGMLDLVNGKPADSKVYLSHKFVRQTACPPPIVDPCPSDFSSAAMWEITWGYGFADRNGGAPKFTMQSNGGLTGINGGNVPAYMGDSATSTWHWLYVNKPATDRVVSYQFADGTQRFATITGDDDGCPTIVWTETAPPIVEQHEATECSALNEYTTRTWTTTDGVISNEASSTRMLDRDEAIALECYAPPAIECVEGSTSATPNLFGDNTECVQVVVPPVVTEAPAKAATVTLISELPMALAYTGSPDHTKPLLVTSGLLLGLGGMLGAIAHTMKRRRVTASE